MRITSRAFAFLVFLLLCGPANAVIIVGGSDLLDASSASQLETWLGQGPLTLTNIFDKIPGDTSVDFHNAVDGLGPTFSLIEVPSTDYGAVVFPEPLIIGGYNPNSWDATIGDYTFTSNLADRTAFIFNLNTLTLETQRLDPGVGVRQVRNGWNFGPTFGGGMDIYTHEALYAGRTWGYSYGDTNQGYYNSIIGDGIYGGSLVFGAIEVFSITVPEPSTVVLLLLGLGLFLGKRGAIE